MTENRFLVVKLVYHKRLVATLVYHTRANGFEPAYQKVGENYLVKLQFNSYNSFNLMNNENNQYNTYNAHDYHNEMKSKIKQEEMKSFVFDHIHLRHTAAHSGCTL